MYNYYLVSNLSVYRLKYGINWIGSYEINTIRPRIQGLEAFHAAIVINPEKRNEPAVLLNFSNHDSVYVNGILIKNFHVIRLSDIITFHPFNYSTQRFMLSMGDRAVS